MSENRRFGRFASGSALSDQAEPVDSLQQADIEIFGGEMPVRRSRVPDNALVKREDGAFVYKQFVLSQNGLIVDGFITKEDWREIGDILHRMDKAIQWAVGDWANQGVAHVDEWVDNGADLKTKYQLLLAETDYSYQTIRDMAWVADAIPLSLRKDTLSYNHHKLFAKYEGELLEMWLAYAEMTCQSITNLRDEMTYIEYMDNSHQLYWLAWALKDKFRLSQDETLIENRPAPSRWISVQAEKDWNYIRTLGKRGRGEDEVEMVRERIQRLRTALDEVESQL